MADDKSATVTTESAGNREQRRRSARRSKKFAAIGSGAVLIAGVAGPGSVLLAGPAAAATFNVDSLADDGTGETLREAIVAANLAAGPDTITFAAGLSGTISLGSDLPNITDTLSIVGPGADVLAVDGGGTAGDGDGNQIFYFDSVTSGTNVVSGLTLTGGYNSYGGAIGLSDGYASLDVIDMVITGNEAEYYGGGVAFDDSTGSLVISGSLITDNLAGEGAGGVYVDSTGDFIISGTTISDNISEGGGGGVHVSGEGTMMVEFSEISDNSADGTGGGFYIYETDVTIESSTISGNSTYSGGGGVYVDNGSDYSFTMRNSTVSGNTSEFYGGGLYFSDSDGSATIENSTISGNTAGQAGAIYGGYGGLTLTQVTITANTATGEGKFTPPLVGGVQLVGAGNTNSAKASPAASDKPNKADKPARGNRVAAAGPGQLEVVGTIIAGNSGQDLGVYSESGPTVSSDHSVLGTVDAAITVTDVGGTQTGVSDPGLAPLAANGGPTQTHALLDGSAALNQGPDPVPSFPGNQFDQRGPGFARVAFGFADVGAFEAQEDEPVVPPAPDTAPADAIVVTPKFTG